MLAYLLLIETLILALSAVQIKGPIAGIFIGGFAIKVWYTGVDLTKNKRLHGTPARIIAIIFMLIALACILAPFFIHEPAAARRD